MPEAISEYIPQSAHDEESARRRRRALAAWAAAAGALAYPLARPLARRDLPARGWLVAAAVPTSVDFALGFFGLWENTHASRFLTASLLGAVVAFYFVPGAVDLALTSRQHLFGRNRNSQPRLSNILPTEGVDGHERQT